MATGTAPHEDHHGLEHLLLDDHPRAVRIAIGLWVIALGLFVGMAIPPVRDAIESMDRWIHESIYPVKWAPLTGLAYALDFLGSAFFVWPLRILITGFLAVRRRWSALTVWLGAVVISEPFIGVLKWAYGRERPPEGLVHEITGSFPSGHSVAGSVVAISLVLCFVRPGPPRRNLEIGAAGFAFIMGGSRMYLGAHWFTDVLAGVAFGAACAIAVATLVQWYGSRRLQALLEPQSESPPG